MSETKFKVGDRVKCIKNIWSRPILNEYSTVCRIVEDSAGIEFDKYIDGHSCHGHCKEGYGWNLHFDEIELAVKFKVGDRVVGIGTWDHKNIDGKYGTVFSTTGSTHNNIAIEFDENIGGHDCSSAGKRCKDGHGWWVNPNQLKLANTPDWKVLIMPEGDKTTGRLYENGKVVKSVETKKHPDDEYSIDKACEVIMERLFPTPKLLDKFEEGKTYVFSEKMHDIDVGASSWCDGLDGKVVTVTGRRDGKIKWFSIVPEWCVEAPKPIEEPKLLNCKIVITESGWDELQVGKIYNIVDGKITINCGSKIPYSGVIKDIDYLDEYFKPDVERKGLPIEYCSSKGIKYVKVVE